MECLGRRIKSLIITELLWDNHLMRQSHVYRNGYWIKKFVCTTLDANGSIVRKDSFGNTFEELGTYLSKFHEGGQFIMCTGPEIN